MLKGRKVKMKEGKMKKGRSHWKNDTERMEGVRGNLKKGLRKVGRNKKKGKHD